VAITAAAQSGDTMNRRTFFTFLGAAPLGLSVGIAAPRTNYVETAIVKFKTASSQTWKVSDLRHIYVEAIGGGGSGSYSRVNG